MSRKDLPLIGILCCAALAPLAAALLSPHLTLGNFGDVYAYHHPLRHLAASRLQAGSVPFWNPYIFSGLPLFANSQASLFYPLSVLFYLLPVGYAFTVFSALHLLLAGMGMYLWCRRGLLPRTASTLLGVAFCLSPFLIYRIPQGVPTHLAGLSFIPWCWLALQSGRPGLLGAIWALQFLSGHPQFSMINAGAMGLYAATRPKSLGVVLLREGAIAASLCLVQLVLTAQFISASSRIGLPDLFFNAYSQPPSALATLLWPGIFGEPMRGTFAGLPSVFFEEYAAYIGLLPLALAVAGLVRRKEGGNGCRGLPSARFGWFLVCVGVFLALGRHNPVLAWAGNLPILGLSRTPARFSLLVVWGLLIAAAGGWTAFRRGAADRALPRGNAASGLRWGAAPGPLARALLLAFVLLDLGLWASRFIYREDPRPYLDPQPAMVAALGGRAVRFASDPVLANPNKAMLYRAMNVNGYDAYYLGRYVAYAARAEGRAAADPSRTHITRFRSPEMRRLGTAYYLSQSARPGPFVPVAGSMRLYRNRDAEGLAYLQQGETLLPAERVAMTRAERWEIHARRPSEGAEDRLVLSVPHYPGWRAWVAGKETPIALHDGLVQSVPLDAVRPGQPFSAVFRFRPTAWTALALATALAWMLWALLWWWPRRAHSSSRRPRGLWGPRAA